VALFVIAPLYAFVVHHRFASPPSPRERQSVRRTNLALLAVTVLMSIVMGLRTFLLIQLTVSAFAGALGVWLYYVQHQFEGAHWARGKEWDYTSAARRCGAVPSISSLKFCSGLPAILAFIIFIT
jgi:acyl-lipid omega-6 desaturase (Delta-12 desaturase)